MHYMSIKDHPELRFIVDPTDSYPDVEPERLVAACGLIPGWINVDDETPFQEQVDLNYGFGLFAFDLNYTTIEEDGTYVYDSGEDEYDDPDMKPYVKWERDGEVAYMYQSAIMSFIKDGKVFVTRVD